MGQLELMSPSLDDAWEPVTIQEAAAFGRLFVDGELGSDYLPMVTVVSRSELVELPMLGISNSAGRMVPNMCFVRNFLMKKLEDGCFDGDFVFISPCSVAVALEIMKRNDARIESVMDVFHNLVDSWNYELSQMGMDSCYRFSWGFMQAGENMMPPIVIRLDRYNYRSDFLNNKC
ncbi:MAG: hypothetical protein ABII07_02100 [Patescibacteria group bacterium]|nr:hypothetical protein [Patescibacteria group bacterium]